MYPVSTSSPLAGLSNHSSTAPIRNPGSAHHGAAPYIIPSHRSHSPTRYRSAPPPPGGGLFWQPSIDPRDSEASSSRGGSPVPHMSRRRGDDGLMPTLLDLTSRFDYTRESTHRMALTPQHRRRPTCLRFPCRMTIIDDRITTHPEDLRIRPSSPLAALHLRPPRNRPTPCQVQARSLYRHPPRAQLHPVRTILPLPFGRTRLPVVQGTMVRRYCLRFCAQDRSCKDLQERYRLCLLLYRVS